MSEHGDGKRTCDRCKRELAPNEQFVTFRGDFGYSPMVCLPCWERR